jgi:hypothetical protein
MEGYIENPTPVSADGDGAHQILTARSRIHEHTISLRFLGIILSVLRLVVSVYNVYMINQLKTSFAQGDDPLVEVTVNSKEEKS